ncbi:hypothetical protein H0H92_007297 [Tricholoma furcatifolium]|nr:hypothetical protein H0H92_007297 [Tricholoma furcatifolium]
MSKLKKKQMNSSESWLRCGRTKLKNYAVIDYMSCWLYWSTHNLRTSRCVSIQMRLAANIAANIPSSPTHLPSSISPTCSCTTHGTSPPLSPRPLPLAHNKSPPVLNLNIRPPAHAHALALPPEGSFPLATPFEFTRRKAMELVHMKIRGGLLSPKPKCAFSKNLWSEILNQRFSSVPVPGPVPRPCSMSRTTSQTIAGIPYNSSPSEPPRQALVYS